VQAVVVATTSPDRICPAVAPEVASALGLGISLGVADLSQPSTNHADLIT
jgi:3-oxoacyl-[acyl-carrier-protein] synthase III